MIALKLTRGRVEVSVNLSENGFRKEKISVNYALAADYAEAAKELSEKYGIVNDLSFSVLARSNEVITLKAQEEEEEVILEMLERTVNDALEVLCRMREFEGERLIADIAGRIDFIEDNLKNFTRSHRVFLRNTPKTQAAYKRVYGGHKAGRGTGCNRDRTFCG